MARYHFVTHLRLGVEPKRVWDSLVQVREWPGWWKWLESVEVVERGDTQGVGAVFRQRIISPLRYRLTWETTIVEREEPSRIDLDSSGDLSGRGRFRLIESEDGVTDLYFVWLVETAKAWMNLLAPFGRPLFGWAHNRLMTDFGIGLAATIGTELLSVNHDTVSPGEEGFYRLPLLD